MSDSPETPALPDFTPVPRKNSVTHGWTAAKQRGFIAALAATGSVRLATQAVGMSHCGVYKLRIAPGGESFAAAWDAAVTRGADQIRDVLIDQAINGVPEPIIHAGKQVAERRRFNHRTMMWVLQHHKPDEYPGGKTTHRRSWDEADAQATVIAEWAATRERLEGRLRTIHERYMTEEIIPFADKRAAYEVLNGPIDWESYGVEIR